MSALKAFLEKEWAAVEAFVDKVEGEAAEEIHAFIAKVEAVLAKLKSIVAGKTKETASTEANPTKK